MTGSFQKTEPRKTADNTVKHCDAGVGLVIANHRGGSESSVTVTRLKLIHDEIKHDALVTHNRPDLPYPSQ